MRLNLKVPFAEKDEAKKLGARWDPARKIWYVPAGVDASAFSRWQPTADNETSAPKGAGSPKMEAASSVRTGPRYLALSCACLPWEGCARCRSALQEARWPH